MKTQLSQKEDRNAIARCTAVDHARRHARTLMVAVHELDVKLTRSCLVHPRPMLISMTHKLLMLKLKTLGL